MSMTILQAVIGTNDKEHILHLLLLSGLTNHNTAIICKIIPKSIFNVDLFHPYFMNYTRSMTRPRY